MIKKSYHILSKNFWLTFWLEHNKTMHDACFLLVAFYSCCQKQVMSRVNNIISSIVNVLWLKKFLDKPLTCKRIFYRKCDKMSLICVDGNLMLSHLHSSYHTNRSRCYRREMRLCPYRHWMSNSNKQLKSFPATERHQRINYYTINPNVAAPVQWTQHHRYAAINCRLTL